MGITFQTHLKNIDMKRFYSYALILSILAATLIGCSKNNDETEPILGSWNATQLEEEGTPNTNEASENEITFNPYNPDTRATTENLITDISYGTYIWTFSSDKTVSIIGLDSGEIGYLDGESPNDYSSYLIDKDQNTIIFSFEDKTKSPVSYDILQLTDSELILKYEILDNEEITACKTIYFNKINE